MQAAITRALTNLDFTAIDFETANELRSSACAIGVVQVRGGEITDSYYTLLQPRLLPHLQGQLVVAHNSAFDVSVLDHSCRDFDLAMPSFHSMCSVKLAKAAWPYLERHRLNHLAAHFGLALNHHDALDDARVCAEVTVRAFRSGFPFPLCFKQRELTAGLAARV